jgi:hypothetical protein
LICGTGLRAKFRTLRAIAALILNRISGDKMNVHDSRGALLSAGDTIRLDRITDDLLDGLLPEDQAAIKNGLGKIWIFEEVSQNRLRKLF